MTKISNDMPSLSTITSTMATIVENKANNFTFGTVDYIVFVFMLMISAGIGVYFGFFSKSKNTTDEYLTGGKRMKTIPIAISLVARLVNSYLCLNYMHLKKVVSCNQKH